MLIKYWENTYQISCMQLKIWLIYIVYLRYHVTIIFLKSLSFSDDISKLIKVLISPNWPNDYCLNFSAGQSGIQHPEVSKSSLVTEHQHALVLHSIK